MARWSRAQVEAGMAFARSLLGATEDAEGVAGLALAEVTAQVHPRDVDAWQAELRKRLRTTRSTTARSKRRREALARRAADEASEGAVRLQTSKGRKRHVGRWKEEAGVLWPTSPDPNAVGVPWLDDDQGASVVATQTDLEAAERLTDWVRAWFDAEGEVLTFRARIDRLHAAHVAFFGHAPADHADAALAIELAQALTFARMHEPSTHRLGVAVGAIRERLGKRASAAVTDRDLRAMYDACSILGGGRGAKGKNPRVVALEFANGRRAAAKKRALRSAEVWPKLSKRRT